MGAGLPALAVSRPLAERGQARAHAATSPAGPRQGLASALTPKRGRCLGPGKKEKGDAPDNSDFPNGLPGLGNLPPPLRDASEYAPQDQGRSVHRSDQIRTIAGFGSHRIHQDIRMPRPAKNDNSAATVGYEAQLWQMADALRGSMDAAEYKHVCLGLLFLKYISDAFEEKHAALLAEKAQGRRPRGPRRVPRARASSGCRPRRAGRT